MFLKSMEDNEILISAPTSETEINLSEDIAKEDNFELVIKEYNDAQELLLADPIHEVKEEEGWSPEKSSLNKDQEDVARREAKMNG